MLPTSNQAYVFLSMVYTGFIIGLIYDFYRIIRRILRLGRFFTGVFDLVFWIAISAFSFIVIFKVNDGDVRLYNIAGLAIGWILYALTLSPYIMKILQFCCNMLTKAVRFIVKIVSWPFRMLFKTVSYPINAIKRICQRLVKPVFIKLRKKLFKRKKE